MTNLRDSSDAASVGDASVNGPRSTLVRAGLHVKPTDRALAAWRVALVSIWSRAGGSPTGSTSHYLQSNGRIKTCHDSFKWRI